MPTTIFAGQRALSVPGQLNRGTNSLRSFLDAWMQPLIAETLLVQRASIYDRLAVLLSAGMSAGQTLNSILEGGTAARYRPALRSAAVSAVEGTPISSTLARFPERFPRLEVEVLKAGEHSGHTAEMADQLANWLREELELRRFVSSQTLYAKITYVVGTIVIPLMIAFIMGGSIVGMLAGIIGYWLGMVAALGAVFYAVRRTIQRQREVAYAADQFIELLPVVGTVSRGLAVSRFVRSFAVLYESGIPIAEAIEVAGEASGKLTLQSQAKQAANQVREGVDLVTALRPMRLRSDVLQAVQTGATSGELGGILSRAGRMLEQDARKLQEQTAFVLAQLFYLLVALSLAFGAVGIVSSFGPNIGAG